MTVKIDRQEQIPKGVDVLFDVSCGTCTKRQKVLDRQPFSFDSLKEAQRVANQHDHRKHKGRGDVLVKWGEDKRDAEDERFQDEDSVRFEQHGDDYEFAEWPFLNGGPDES